MDAKVLIIWETCLHFIYAVFSGIDDAIHFHKATESPLILVSEYNA